MDGKILNIVKSLIMKNKTDGFSLLEAIVALAILSLAVIAMSTLFVRNYATVRTAGGHSEELFDARRAMDNFIRDLDYTLPEPSPGETPSIVVSTKTIEEPIEIEFYGVENAIVIYQGKIITVAQKYPIVRRFNNQNDTPNSGTFYLHTYVWD